MVSDRNQCGVARLTYTGGYVLPGTTPQSGQIALPDDLEQAAVEQVAFWFQNRDRLGLKTHWPSGDAYRQFATQDLLDSVQAVLAATAAGKSRATPLFLKRHSKGQDARLANQGYIAGQASF